MRAFVRVTALALTTLSAAALSAQTPLGKEAADRRSHLALQALDRYLETWNSRDPERWAASLNFPHVRPGPGAFELFRTPAQYVASVTFAQTLATGWHHSEWTTRRVLQLGLDKVHVAGSWLRYTADGSANGVNVAVTCSRRDRSGEVVSKYEAVVLVVRRDEAWKVQAVSTMGT